GLEPAPVSREGAIAVSPERPEVPPIELLLEIDAAYRMLAEGGKLRRVAPRLHNPRGEAWLPLMVEERGGWRFTVAYSNSEAAHRTGKLADWVVLRYARLVNRDAEGRASDLAPSSSPWGAEAATSVEPGSEGQYTVVTETRGPEAGLRVVRGREHATHAHYLAHPPIRAKLPLPAFLVGAASRVGEPAPARLRGDVSIAQVPESTLPPPRCGLRGDASAGQGQGPEATTEVTARRRG
ncbi:MAG: hypothetical protein KC731_34450, partial [Myxococcales bacterium]|nr:hypothetical protein [Myxococcales bacterium]